MYNPGCSARRRAITVSSNTAMPASPAVRMSRTRDWPSK